MSGEVEILAIGDELVAGHVVDTNSAFLSRELATLGLVVARITVVGDGEDELVDALRGACTRSETVLATGGLGPTGDDRTRAAAARLVGEELVFDAAAWKTIEAFFRSLGWRKKQPAASNKSQAFFPPSARVLVNEWGTAPGFALRVAESTLYALPGVPSEMRAMYEQRVAPELAARGGVEGLSEHCLQVVGCREAELGEWLAPFLETTSVTQPRVGVTADYGQLTVRVTGRSASAVRRTTAEIRPLLGEFLAYEGSHSLAEEVGRRLLANDITVALAESCTGGLLGGLLTEVPGISAVFLAGFVTYSNAAKMRDLGVPEDLLLEHGAVSIEVARAMAAGAARRSGARASVAITGVAGPGGGSPDKPVGSVCFGVSMDGLTTGQELRMGNPGRRILRQRALRVALLLLYRNLPGGPRGSGDDLPGDG